MSSTKSVAHAPVPSKQRMKEKLKGRHKELKTKYMEAPSNNIKGQTIITGEEKKKEKERNKQRANERTNERKERKKDRQKERKKEKEKETQCSVKKINKRSSKTNIDDVVRSEEKKNPKNKTAKKQTYKTHEQKKNKEFLFSRGD